jgi:hypothetical protein
VNLRFNLYDTDTASGIINRYGFREDGRKLTAANLSANSESINYAATLPYELVMAVGVTKRNSSTPKLTPKTQYGGRLYVTPTTFDIATRIRNLKRQ